MLVKIAGMVVINSKGNVAGVVQMDTVAEKVGPLEMDVMVHSGVMKNMFALLSQRVSSIFFSLKLLKTYIYIYSVGLVNAGQDCLTSCNGIQGKCSWCGSDGYCCRKGWTPGNGCDGSFGGNDKHACDVKPTSELNYFLL